MRDQPVGLIFLPPAWLLKYDLQMLKQNLTSLGYRPTTRQKAGYAPELKSGYAHCDHTRKKRENVPLNSHKIYVAIQPTIW